MSRTCPVLVLDPNVTRNNALSQLFIRHHFVRYVIPIYSIEAGLQFLRGASLKLIYIQVDDLDNALVFSFIAQAFKEVEGVSVVLMTDDPQRQTIMRAACEGVKGFVFNDENPFILFQSLQQMIDFGAYIHPMIAPIFLRDISWNQEASEAQPDAAAAPPHSNVSSELTPREQDVLTYLAKGFTANEIASSLGISGHTVASHTKNVYRKLVIHTKGEAILEAIRMGLVSVDNINVAAVSADSLGPMAQVQRKTLNESNLCGGAD